MTKLDMDKLNAISGGGGCSKSVSYSGSANVKCSKNCKSS